MARLTRRRALATLESRLIGGRGFSTASTPEAFALWRTEVEDFLAEQFGDHSVEYRDFYHAAKEAHAILVESHRGPHICDAEFALRQKDCLAVLENASNALLVGGASGPGLIVRLTSWIKKHKTALFWIGFLGSIASVASLLKDYIHLP